jgi:zinc-binding alcohol dehydrogenase family protein
MKAVGLTRYLPHGHPDALVEQQLPDPIPGVRDLLVEVKAVAVNPLDNRVRRPKDKIESSLRVLGWDAAGVVKATGAGVTAFRPGDRVFYAGDIARPGSNSELQLVDERLAGFMPVSLDFAQAAALPLSTITAWEALFDRMRVPREGPRGSILIIGAAGGVGSMATQLASKVAGLTVIGTASRPESAQWVKDMGAHHVLDHSRDLGEQLRMAGFAHVDYVLILADTGRYYPIAAELVAPQGTVGLAVEVKEPVDLGLMWDKSVTLAWEMVFTRTDFSTHDMAAHRDILNEVSRLVDMGRIRTTMTRKLAPISAANLDRAHAALAAGHQVGKLVLEGF